MQGTARNGWSRSREEHYRDRFTPLCLRRSQPPSWPKRQRKEGIRKSGLSRKTSSSRETDARPLRQALVQRHGKCMVCQHSPLNPWRDKPLECSRLCCHEIKGGPWRQIFLDQPCGILVVCWHCNSEVLEDKALWTEARQLALLRSKSPDYDLVKYNELVNKQAPNRVTPEDVAKYS
jgi:hypothetical protein